VEKILNEEGKFYATFFETSKKFELSPTPQPRIDGDDMISFFDKDPFHYSFDIFEWICKDIDMKVDYIGEWNHPRNQKILVFTKSR
jgi:hypothetical protein